MDGCITRFLKVSFHRSRSYKSVFVITTNRTTVYFLFMYKCPRLIVVKYILIYSLSISLSISNFSYEDRYLEVVLMLSKLERILVVGWFSVLLLTLCFLMPNTGIVISLFFLCTCLYCFQNLLFLFVIYIFYSVVFYFVFVR